MCPSYRVTARRARRHARARQHAAPRHHRPARAGRAHLRRDGGDAEALRLLQGLPARMPDRRRHGAHEDRGAGGARGQARPVAARPAGRLSAALCAAARRSVPRLLNLRDAMPRLRRSCRSGMPASARDATCRAGAPTLGAIRPHRSSASGPASGGRRAARSCLFADTFNRYFERENLDAALAVLAAGGYRVHLPKPADGSRRPLCCGRTFLSVGLGRRGARAKPSARVAALAPFVARGMPVVGLEPSCLLGFRDEIPALIKSEDARRLAANALLFEEFSRARRRPARLAAAAHADRASARCCTAIATRNRSPPCAAVEAVLKLVPDLAVETVESSCCGMAGAFGYGADTIDVSLAMGELSLLPAVRKAPSRRHHRRRRHVVPAPDRATAPAARRCMSRACWPMSELRRPKDQCAASNTRGH